MGLKYFMRSKESWKQLVERVHHYKTPQLFSQPNHNDALSSSPTVTRRSMGKRGKRLPLFLRSGEGEEGDAAEGGEDSRWLSKHTRRCKGE